MKAILCDLCGQNAQDKPRNDFGFRIVAKRFYIHRTERIDICTQCFQEMKRRVQVQRDIRSAVEAP